MVELWPLIKNKPYFFILYRLLMALFHKYVFLNYQNSKHVSNKYCSLCPFSSKENISYYLRFKRFWKSKTDIEYKNSKSLAVYLTILIWGIKKCLDAFLISGQIFTLFWIPNLKFLPWTDSRVSGTNVYTYLDKRGKVVS